MTRVTDDQITFLKILSDYINDRENTYILSPEIFSYAKSHELEGIVYKQCKSAKLQKKFYASVYQFENKKNYIKELNDVLSDIPHFFVKGFELAKYYKYPPLRTMGDVDLLVKKEDILRVRSLLKEQGFSLCPEVESVSVATKDSFVLEIHTSLIHSGIGDEKASEYFSSCWNYVKDNQLDKSYHFVFVIQHLKGHIISEGVGFRQFMDVALFSRDTELNWDWIEAELVELDLLKFTKIVFAFIQRWFKIDSPIGVINIDDIFFEDATQRIFLGGVFGQEDQSNKNTGITKQAINGGYGLRKAKCIYLLKQLFPDFRTMSRLSYCSYVRKTKLMLPVSWIHRIIYRGLSKEYRKNFIYRNTLRETLKERLNYFGKWGL